MKTSQSEWCKSRNSWPFIAGGFHELLRFGQAVEQSYRLTCPLPEATSCQKMCHFRPGLAASLLSGQSVAWPGSRVSADRSEKSRRRRQVDFWWCLSSQVASCQNQLTFLAGNPRLKVKHLHWSLNTRQSPLLWLMIWAVVHHDATPTVHLKCSVRPLRYPICASCHLHPCSRNAEAFQGGETCPQDSGWWTTFPIDKWLFHHVMETLPRTVWLSSEQKYAKTLKTMEKTHRGKTGEKCDGTWS